MNRLLLLTLIIVTSTLGSTRLALADDIDQDHKTTTMPDKPDKDEDRFPKDNEKQDQKLAKEFNVSESLIDSLRKQKLGYGEIRHVLTIAEQMPGGINDANTKKIMDMRQGGAHKEGWGRIAQELGAKLNPKNKENEHAENHENKNAENHENAGEKNHDWSRGSAGMPHGMGDGMGHGHGRK